MPNKSMSDLMARVPGDYVVELGSYPSYEAFERDLIRIQSLCHQFDDFFAAVEDPRTRRVEAFFAHVSTLPQAMKRVAPALR